MGENKKLKLEARLTKALHIVTVGLPAASLVMIVLKLCGVLPWGWWLVTAGLWGTVVLYLTLFAFVFLAFFIIEMITNHKTGKRAKTRVKMNRTR